jgi:transketolase
MTLDQLKHKSLAYRRDILSFIYESGAGHTGGSLSCIDILNVLYNAVMDIRPENWQSLQRDFYIQSKGHSVEALYIVLADLGFFDPSELETGNRFQTRLIGHPTRKLPGIEHNTGGLGHGLSVSVGLALAAKLDKRSSRVFCLLGDGELSEGSNWEAALSAAHYKLDNLTAVVDRNGLQITGTTAQVNDLEPLKEKWNAFGWAVRRTDGHDHSKLLEAFSDLPFARGKPGVLIADTVKGRGVSFIEGNVEWHHKVPSREQYQLAMRELEVRP